jgi:putative heme-binding domain-containing protein
MEPSVVVEEKYRSYVLETKGGLVHSGMLVERNAREVVLKDPKNQPIRVPAGDIESLQPQSKSLMPEALLRELSAQEAADLLDYLASLKAPSRPVSAR